MIIQLLGESGVSAAGVGEWFEGIGYRVPWPVQVVATGACSIEIQATIIKSIGGADRFTNLNPTTLTFTVGGTEWLAIVEPWPLIRANVTAHTSGIAWANVYMPAGG